MPGDTTHVHTKIAQQNKYDALVIGSGISGGWAAKELTEKGLSVLLLERGRNIAHIKDYTTSGRSPWEHPRHGAPSSTDMAKRPVVARGWAINHPNLEYWANEQDCPYTEIKPFTWWRSYHLGGRSLLWGRQSYRWSDFDFEANAREGVAVDWPIRYKDLAPWYDYVERFAGISGQKKGCPNCRTDSFCRPWT